VLDFARILFATLHHPNHGRESPSFADAFYYDLSFHVKRKVPPPLLGGDFILDPSEFYNANSVKPEAAILFFAVANSGSKDLAVFASLPSPHARVANDFINLNGLRIFALFRSIDHVEGQV
jgi:hypothetical protein